MTYLPIAKLADLICGAQDMVKALALGAYAMYDVAPASIM